MLINHNVVRLYSYKYTYSSEKVVYLMDLPMQLQARLRAMQADCKDAEILTAVTLCICTCHEYGNMTTFVGEPT